MQAELASKRVECQIKHAFWYKRGIHLIVMCLTNIGQICSSRIVTPYGSVFVVYIMLNKI